MEGRITVMPGQVWRDRTYDGLARQTAGGTMCRISPSARTIRITGYGQGEGGAVVSFRQITDREGRIKQKEGVTLLRTLRRSYDLVEDVR